MARSASVMDGSLRRRVHVWALPILTVMLLGAGWAGIFRSEQITDGSGRLLRQQIVWSILGLVSFAICSAVNYRRVARLSGLAYITIAVALLAVYFFPAVNGAHRWVRVAGIGIQPSEFAKLILIVTLAGYLMHRDIASGLAALFWPLAITGALVLLVLPEPDLGTSLVFLPVLLVMLFAAGARQRDLLRLMAAGIMLLPLLWGHMSREQHSRITALWEQNGPHETATPDGFHLDQAKRTFALGNVWGTFFTSESDDDLPACHVPEPHTDSIYCVLGERFGIVGAGCVLLLFIAVIGICLSVANRTEEPFGRLLAVGVAALFAGEVLINTGMLVGLLPVTGVSLPLVSYGGSGLTAHLLALGLVTSVARHAA